jgi:tRNA A37 threonylcarbamoyladenosine synthetase subunit TsaC/SUA5/YrdC
MASTSRMPTKVTAQTMETVYALLALSRSNEQLGKQYYLRDRSQPNRNILATEPVPTKWQLRDRNQLKQPVRFY